MKYRLLGVLLAGALALSDLRGRHRHRSPGEEGTFPPIHL